MKRTIQKINSLFIIYIIIITNGCAHFSISEKDATETAERFFSLSTMKNNNDKIQEIYPKYNKIGEHIFFKNKCSISNISETSNGDYEVYANYFSNDNNSIPILLVIGMENGNTIIKYSKGINFSYYDKTYDYAKKKGCINGNENDIELGEIIKNKGLYSELEDETDVLGNNLHTKLRINSNNLTYENGLVTGNVTIFNNSEIDLSYSDIECKINLLDEHGNVLKSIDLNAYEGIKANNMANIRVYSTFNGEVFMSNDKIVFNNSTSLRNKLKESIIKNTNIGCN